MALFSRFFNRKPPDHLLEISERVFVFDCCFSTEVLEEDELKVYMDAIVAILQDHYPDSCFMVFNFAEGDKRTQIQDVLSEYDMTVMDYPRQFEGCPILSLEMVHRFLKSCECLLEGQQNVVLMYCETGGWPVLAFMLAALLLFRKLYNSEQKPLEMLYKQAPRKILSLLTPLNPQASQLRYLHYIGFDWKPTDTDTSLVVDYIVLKNLPKYQPIVRLFGQDPFSSTANKRSKLLFSSDKNKQKTLYYDPVMIIDIYQRVQGDVVLECTNFAHASEEMIFRVMFHTNFVRQGVLMLSRDDVDVLWDPQIQMPENFGAEVLFSDVDALPSMITTGSPNVINGEDGLLPDESRIEKGDEVSMKEPKPEVDACEDYKLDDENKKSETKVYDLGHVNSGLKQLKVAVSNETGVNSVSGSDRIGKQNAISRPKEWQHLQKSLKEIEIATKNFQDCIGKGGFGRVYKGTLFKSGNSIPVAVKRLNEQYGQGLKEFLTEVHLLSALKHPNVISLLGYCEDGNEKILVYEYAERGSLAQYLRRSNATYTFTWLERLKICVDAARGLNHLHDHGKDHVTIIHRDIKSANILLDQNWVAKIADFGLSKLTSGDLNGSFVISHACGTPGYCEPEYIITGIVKKESDIFSFGMVLFEILCGRLCTYRDNDGFLLSCPLAKKYFEQKKLDEIVDPSLREQLNLDSVNKFSEIAYGCLHEDRRQRPPMVRVLKELEELLKLIQDQTVK